MWISLSGSLSSELQFHQTKPVYRPWLEKHLLGSSRVIVFSAQKLSFNPRLAISYSGSKWWKGGSQHPCELAKRHTTESCPKPCRPVGIRNWWVLSQQIWMYQNLYGKTCLSQHASAFINIKRGKASIMLTCASTHAVHAALQARLCAFVSEWRPASIRFRPVAVLKGLSSMVHYFEILIVLHAC